LLDFSTTAVYNSAMITITVTESAKKGLADIIEKRGIEMLGLRLQINGGIPGAWQSDFRPVRPGEERSDDIIFEQGSFNIYVDPESATKLDGVNIDMVPTFGGPAFKIEYPQPEWDNPLAQKVQDLINTKVNPGLASHGGFVALQDVKDGAAELIMGGGCQGCSLSAATMRQGIETMLKDEIPELKEIIDITDHESGANPYYKASDEGESALTN
jgi:Fe/S biogenesis protein NfuA